MAGVPFLYINLTAFCLYVLFLAAFLAAKKSPEIRSFIVVMFGFALWSGASVLMRLEVWPGLNFWFYVSLLALFGEGWLCYSFVLSYAHEHRPKQTIFWTIGMLVILVLSACGLFLKPPVPEITEQGKIFRYSMTWTVAIPYVYLMAQVVAIVLVLRRLIRRVSSSMPGLKSIIFGCVVIGVGNIMQILPGNIFPWDQVTGILFAIALAYGLNKKRLFTMTLLINRRVLTLVSLIISILLLASFIEPLRSLLAKIFPYDENTLTLILVLIFSVFMLLFYTLIDRLTSVLYNLKNQQELLISSFSDKVTKSLNTSEITRELLSAVQAGIAVDRIFIMLKDSEAYTVRADSAELGGKVFRITPDSPLITALKNSDGYFIMEEFRATSMYRSLWDEEKTQLLAADISCVVAMNDGEDIAGLIMLTSKEKRSSFTGSEINYLTTLSSVASIAVKNAALYEQMYREARIDSLTGVGNYRAFMESIAEKFRDYGSECLALIDIDIDDFKLYNQLYGTIEGDMTLKRVAEIISTCVNGSGEVFRTSGKIFSILLPLYDGKKAQDLTEVIRREILAINNSEQRKGYKNLTISAGICVSPSAASSVRELIDNADLAVFTAKSAGKDRIFIRQCEGSVNLGLRDRVRSIIQRKDDGFEQNLSIISALTAAIDAKDHYTCQHSNNVAEYAALLAAASGLGDNEVRMVYHAGLLHDIGKISIPEAILGKQAALTDEEFDIMKGHVNGSIEMIRHLPAMDYMIPAVVGHHERWDGRGYPRGIGGEEIPITARCLALADTFDAITTDRPYRKGLSIDYAVEQIERNIGKQFDPVLAETFIGLIKDEVILLNTSLL